MDPVNRILVERERTRPKLMPWLILAIAMHAGVAAATFLVGRRTAARRVQLPVVAVKIVRPQAPQRPAPRSTSPPSRSTPVPQVTQPPATAVPRPTAVATAPPEPVEPAEVTKASADAMRSEDSRSTPVPTPPPAEGGGGGEGGGTSSGLSVGSTGGGGTTGIPADFHFTYYIERMLALIESRWYKPAASTGVRARVGFVIMKDGKLKDIRLEESSGLASFDRAALRALYAANPLPPLPPAYGKPSLTVHLSFTE